MKENKFLVGLLTGITSTICIVSLGFILYNTDIVQNLVYSSATNSKTQDQLDYSTIQSKVKMLEYYIDKYYLEDVDVESIEDNIYKGVLNGLDDPYSVYYTKEEYQKLMESTSGTYCGIGATVSQDASTGVVTIVKPFSTGAAYEAGILPGDIIYKVEGKEVTGMDLNEVVSRMKGEEGTKVKITIMREGESDPIDFTIVRRTIEVPTVEYEMLDHSIGYIAVSEFDQVTVEQFKNALDDLKKKNMKGLVIDLRNNPGGMLDSVVSMLDEVIDNGLLVYTKDKNGDGQQYSATNSNKVEVPMTVLINGNSASASEVFAGAVQDYGVATLVGTTSFGKGIVQNVMELPDGTAIKLTVSKYYTPNGRNIHGTGIEPDVKVELEDELKQKTVIKKDEDNQLQKAIEVLEQKMDK